MDKQSPIYTEKTECQDCYKCVRNCPVKAIQIKNNTASVIKKLCIYCGKCVSVCPSGAKKIRNDIDRAKILLKIKKKVIASIAPSFVAEFNHIPITNLLSVFKKLGFYGVSETALGAEIISENIKNEINNKNFIISSACPTIVEYIKKYKHELVKNI